MYASHRQGTAKPWIDVRSPRNAIALVIGACFLAAESPASAANPSVDWTTDYEEHTGYIINHEDYLVEYERAFETLQAAFSSTTDQYADLHSLKLTLDDRPRNRKNVRFIKHFGDAPVYIAKNHVLLPDNNDVAWDPNSPAFTEQCAGNPRCISISRYDNGNINAAALVLVARTIVVQGTSQTDGLSLITASETLVGTGKLILSARSDYAPSMWDEPDKAYAVNPLDTSTIIPDIASAANVPTLGPSLDYSGNRLWAWNEDPQGSIYDDLTWQYRRAALMSPDYADYPDSMCDERGGAAAIANCKKILNPRGFAGLPGGSWVGFTFRATGISAVSDGQPGGNGHKGYQGQNIEGYDAINCSDYCAEKTCEQTYRNEDPASDCVRVCNPTPFADGLRGGQAGFGGEHGFVSISSVTHIAPCWDWSPSNLAQPGGADALDKRCSNGKADDGDEQLIDCDAPECYGDPNVTVCTPKPIYAKVPGWLKQWYSNLEYYKPGLPFVPATGATLPSGWLSKVSTRLDDGAYAFAGPTAPTTTVKPTLLDQINVGFALDSIKTASVTVPLEIVALDAPPLNTQSLVDQLARANADTLPKCGTPHQCTKTLKPFTDAIMQPGGVEALRQLRAQAMRDGESADTPITVLVLKRGAKVETYAGVGYHGMDFAPGNPPPPPPPDGGPGQFCFDVLGLTTALHHGVSGQPGDGGDKNPDIHSYCLGQTPHLSYMCHVVPAAPISDGGVGSFYYWPVLNYVSSASEPTCARTDFDVWFTGPYPHAYWPGNWNWNFLPLQQVPLDDGSKCTNLQTEPAGNIIESNYNCAADPSCSRPELHNAVNVRCESQTGDAGSAQFNTAIHFVHPSSQMRSWTLPRFSRMLDKLHPQEFQRRISRANRLYKQGDWDTARAKYLSTQKFLSPLLPLVLPNVPSPCGDGYAPPDSVADMDASIAKLGNMPADQKYACARKLEIDLYLGRLKNFLNFYGYTLEFAPPTAARFAELSGDTRSLLETANSEVAKWLTLSNDLQAQTVSITAAEVSTQIQSKAYEYDKNGALYTEFQNTFADDADVMAQYLKLQSDIANYQVALANLSLQVKTGIPHADDTFETVLNVVYTAAVIIGSFYGGGGAAAAGAYVAQGGYTVWYESKEGVPAKDIGDVTKDSIGTLIKKTMDAGNDNAAMAIINDIIVVGAMQSTIDAIHGFLLETMRLGREHGRILRARSLAAAKIRDSQRQVVELERLLATLQKLGQPQGEALPVDAQEELIHNYFMAAGQYVDLAGEYFFLTRRAAERDTSPWDPAAKKSALDPYDANALTYPVCVNNGVSQLSLDINFKTIECFTARLDTIEQYVNNAYTNTGSPTYPVMVDNFAYDSATQKYRFSVDVSVDDALLLGEAGQRIVRERLYLITDQPEPAITSVRVRRPSISDNYIVGIEDTSAIIQTFVLGAGSAADPLTPLGVLLQSEPTTWQNTSICVGSEATVSQNSADCTLEAVVDPGSEKVTIPPLVHRSLVGRQDFEITVQALTTGTVPRVPVAFKPVLVYEYTHIL